jgi:hypothetical protein
MRKMDWSKCSRKQIATKSVPMNITEADLGPLLDQLFYDPLYDPIYERVASQDRGLITDVEFVQTKPEID